MTVPSAYSIASALPFFATALAITIASIAPASAFAADSPSTSKQDQFRREIGQIYPEIETLYKDLHAHPELGFEEKETSRKLAEAMRAIGFEVTENVGRTGVVAVLKNGAGPTVLVRTDMDALPMEEKTGLPYSSKAKATYLGKETMVAHSCGHDLHMANWVGTARLLSKRKDEWKGTLLFIAQPADELLGGAKAMLDDGLYTRFGKPDYAFALHTAPMPAGLIGFNTGAVTSNSDSFEAKFHGHGGHGSAPNTTVDPVVLASRFIVDVQSVISREKDPFKFGVFSIGAIHGGSAGNIIPDTVEMSGTIRSYDQDVRKRMHDGIRRTALASATMAGAPEPTLQIIEGGNAVMNDVSLVDATEAALKTNFGERVLRIPPITASEDFSEYGAKGVPSMFFFLGVSDPKAFQESRKPGGKPLPSNHSPLFAPIPEPSLKAGMEAMTTAVMGMMKPR